MAEIREYAAIIPVYFAFIELYGILYHQEVDKQDYSQDSKESGRFRNMTCIEGMIEHSCLA